MYLLYPLVTPYHTFPAHISENTGLTPPHILPGPSRHLSLRHQFQHHGGQRVHRAGRSTEVCGHRDRRGEGIYHACGTWALPHGAAE